MVTSRHPTPTAVESSDSASVDHDDSSDQDPADWQLQDHASRESEGQRYINEMKRLSGLYLLCPEIVKKAYDTNRELGLFGLFFTEEAREKYRAYANSSTNLKRKISQKEFNTYIGLEIAMGLIKLTKIRDYWSTKPFLRQEDFRRAMPRDRFKDIRSSIRFTFQISDEVQPKEHDPLWHSRTLLTDFLQRCQQVAVPLYATSLDENSCRTKARTKAKSYLPTKPDKFAIRFYCVVDWKTLYLHSFFDNGSGNTMPTTIVRRVLDIFPE